MLCAGASKGSNRIGVGGEKSVSRRLVSWMDHASQRYLHTISLASCNAVDREIRRLIVAINRSLISSSSASDTVYTCSWFCLRPVLHSAVLTLRHFHRTRLAAFQLAELTLVNEPVRTGIAHAAGPNQNVVLGFDDRKGMIAAGRSHAWHRVRVSKDGLLLAFAGHRQRG